MLQSLYSRSGVSIEKRLREIFEKEQRETGKEPVGTDGKASPSHSDAETEAMVHRLMQTFYVGYGHQSIGDCGNVTLFIEDVPIHLPTQIQDSALYSGQEMSTRFISYTGARLLDPINSPVSALILKRWMDFLQHASPIMTEALKEENPLIISTTGGSEDSQKKNWERAIYARTCDILRGFLPSGAVTSVSWSVNLRQAIDHARRLQHHPDILVRELALDIIDFLRALYPSSFGHKEREETAAWLDLSARDVAERVEGSKNTVVRVTMEDLARYRHVEALLAHRPRSADVSRHFGNVAQISVKTQIDQGSYRDLHRHRVIDQPVPLMIWDGAVHPFYLEALPAHLRAEASELLRKQFALYEQLSDEDPYLRQCYAPLGQMIPLDMRGNLGAFIYMLELRSKPDVHPTVRSLVHEIADRLLEQLPSLVLHVNREPSRFNLKRGGQTIFNKTTGEAIGQSTQANNDRIITLVGVDGCGKDTVLERLTELLTQKTGSKALKLREFELEHKRFPTQEELKDIALLVVAEPTYSPPTGTAIREGMLPTDKPAITAKEEGLLYADDRKRLYQELILPFLAKPGTWVIQNRSVLCSLVFQSLRWPEGNTEEAMKYLLDLDGNRLELEHPPRHMLLLDLDPQTGSDRLKARGNMDRIEQDTDLQKRVRARYLDPTLQNLFLSRGTRIHVIDAAAPKEGVSAVITDLFPTLNVC